MIEISYKSITFYGEMCKYIIYTVYYKIEKGQAFLIGCDASIFLIELQFMGALNFEKETGLEVFLRLLISIGTT